MVKNKQQQEEVIAYITSTCNDLKKNISFIVRELK